MWACSTSPAFSAVKPKSQPRRKISSKPSNTARWTMTLVPDPYLQKIGLSVFQVLLTQDQSFGFHACLCMAFPWEEALQRFQMVTLGSRDLSPLPDVGNFQVATSSRSHTFSPSPMCNSISSMWISDWGISVHQNRVGRHWVLS